MGQTLCLGSGPGPIVLSIRDLSFSTLSEILQHPAFCHISQPHITLLLPENLLHVPLALFLLMSPLIGVPAG